MLLYLTRRGARKLGDEFEAPGHIVRGEAGAAKRVQLGAARMPPIRRHLDEGPLDLAPLGIRLREPAASTTAGSPPLS